MLRAGVRGRSGSDFIQNLFRAVEFRRVWRRSASAPPLCLPSQGKLVKYFSRQLSCKRKVALEERSGELEDFPRLGHWFRIVNLRKEVTQVTLV